MENIKIILKKSPVYILLLLGGMIMIFPFIWMVSTSFTPNLFVIKIPPELIPANASFDNFIKAWNANNFQLYFLNSAFVAIIATILTGLFSAMAAYAFARFEFPGKEFLFFLLLGVMMVPNMVAIIPQFLLMKFLNLRNSLWGLILIYTATGFSLNIFLLRGFFEQLPRELEEAVLIDGGNYITIFSRIILPLIHPGSGDGSASFHQWDSGRNLLCR